MEAHWTKWIATHVYVDMDEVEGELYMKRGDTYYTEDQWENGGQSMTDKQASQYDGYFRKLPTQK